MPIIAPSILNSDFLSLGQTIHIINESEAGWIHLDVMDGSFVPNISFGIPVVEAISQVARKPLDTHLMIINPEKYIEGFRKAGADLINIHYEACKQKNIRGILADIRSLGARPALTINPDTPVESVFNFLSDIDMILVMSVFPGFGGQKFIETTYERVRKLHNMIESNNLNTLIEVDGGVSASNISALSQAGVDVIVVGSVIFKSQNPMKTISELHSLAEAKAE